MSDITDAGKKFLDKDMEFALAVSGLEDLKSRMQEEARMLHKDDAIYRTETQGTIASQAVCTAFTDLPDVPIFLSLSEAFDTIWNEGFDHEEDVDNMVAIVRTARVIFGQME